MREQAPRMFGPEKYRVEPDDDQVAWCLLSLETVEEEHGPRIVGWSIALANTQELINFASRDILGHNEQQLVRSLFAELEPYKYENVTLVTIDQTTVALLRTRAVKTNLRGASFRGFTHIRLDKLLQEYFEIDILTFSELKPELGEESVHGLRDAQNGGVDDRKLESLLLIWVVLQEISTLIPTSSLSGDPL